MVSCQHFEHGYYTAYQHLAQEDLDLVVHLGDYLYETARPTGSPGGIPRRRRRTLSATGYATPCTGPTLTCRRRMRRCRSW